MENPQKISDKKLLALCLCFGRRAQLWRRKFIGLLPEVNRRSLYERRGCSSIFEFAFKFAGLSKEQVQRVFQLERQFEDKPALHTVLVEGQVSMNKLARVASIATLENEAALANQVRLLSQKTLETLVRDERENDSPEPLFEEKVVRAHNFELSEEVVQELNRLSEQGQDVNAILLELLQGRRAAIEEKKVALAEETQVTDSRYIPVAIRRVLKEEHGSKCSMPTCARPAQEIHHTQRFSLARTHDPHYLAPLCREHHQLAHAVDIKYHQVRTG